MLRNSLDCKKFNRLEVTAKDYEDGEKIQPIDFTIKIVKSRALATENSLYCFFFNGISSAYFE